MKEVSPEMRLFSPEGERLYLTSEERKRFLTAANEEDRAERLYCQLLHYTGCRPSEALELPPGQVLIDEQCVVFRCLKKRKKDGRGRVKQPEYRSVPIPRSLIENIDLFFDIRNRQRRKQRLKEPLFPWSRPTAYRLVKRVMRRAKVSGKRATGKGLRHAFGIKMASGSKPLPIHLLAEIMGHTSTKTTEIYLKFVGDEKKKLVLDAWEE